MCGIVGYISEKEFDNKKLLDSISHRGPNDDGLFLGQHNKKRIFLGHKRLSILDLSPAGHQPMFSQDKSVVLVYNGEIYNYLDLKSKYLQNVSMNSSTDTEVILNLYLLLGESFVNELNGDFSIAIYDKRNNTILLYRDRLGVKPLYYSIVHSNLMFASELKPFFVAKLHGDISEEQLMNFFIFKYSPQDLTLFDNIKRISPGSVLKYNLDNFSVSIKKYWELDYKKNHFISYNDAKASLYELLDDAVHKRLISDVPVGTFFSGGLDSSIIAYFLRDNKNITHYTARKNENDLKEEGTSSDFYYAKILANKWELKLKQIEIGGSDANNELIDLTTFYSDDLIADGSQIPSYLITKEASFSSTVLLSGMGADEIFLGYGNHLLTLISNYFDNSPRLFTNLILSILKNVKQGKGHFKGYKRFLKKIGKYYHLPNYKYGLYSIVGDFENSYKVIKSSNESAINIFNNYFNNEQDPFNNLLKFEAENFLVKNLHYLDRMCMANSVEGRVPFMDHRLVEFVVQLPKSFKLSNLGFQKKILKQTFQNHVPKEILYRRKAGFGMPLRSIFKNQGMVEKLVDYDFLCSFNYFNIEHIKEVIKKHQLGYEDNSAIIFAIISFQSWYKNHLT